ncbi:MULTISPECIES: YvcK family protein [Bacillaceae]|uniref:gluconeogenesis factor YvcK family protein n=1 Tax=Bacillaceae TaxID=186817 RepID=UPI001E5895FB|nr:MULTISPECIES: YvcK family protein [Bacillaceae]MCE4050362.1 YvcK family protein [Bacillus sp. Au-Bac7]MCM3029598.1 YvcK family protein [Niallia sp. MER 6]MDL0437074.1 YvcK family protein [Niallia sp. SS-2023]UPO87133.1 YvcK family protein [Niallia sp. Man26]
MNEVEHPRIVIIGGGTGLSVLVRGLKKYPLDITAIVTVADDGGSSGRLRDDLDIPAPGDIRNVLAALSDVEPLVEEMFQHRFSNSKDLNGHSLGNLIIAAMTSITGNFTYAIQEMSKVLNVRGKVLPATSHSVVLNARMEDGSIVTGESRIPESGKKIKEVFLTPEHATPLPEAIQAIRHADLIVIGPGSLYTSILPNLVVPEISREIMTAAAKKVYICNIMTQAGETLDYSASDHVKAIYEHMPEPFLNTILVNKENIPANVLERYNEEKAKPVFFDTEKLEKLGLEVILGEIISLEEKVIRHNTLEVAKILYSMLDPELKADQ